MEQYLYPVPPFAIEKDDVEGFVEKLKEFHVEFSDCFVRSEPRGNFFDYMTGLFSSVERKSVEPIAVNVSGKESVRPMQRFLSDAIWHEEKMLFRYHDMVQKGMGDEAGVLMIDESGIIKKGDDSAGVSRQYCGSVGKVENCQVGVYMGICFS
jgi:SRSO17 transposase